MPARFFYARFSTADSRAAVDWMRAVNEVASGHAGSAVVRVPETRLPSAGPVLAWRLVSENRREIARGCRLFATEQEAQSDIAPLLRAAHQLTIHASPAPRLRSTGWFMTLNAEVAMMGARRYESRSTALNAAALAIRLLTELADAAAAGEDPVDRSTPELAL